MVRRVLHLLILFLASSSAARAGLVNRTIDDTYGDSVTGQRPVYLPTSPWAGPSCTTCAITPNESLAFDGTWMGATYNPSLFNNMNVTFSFTGVSIWIFFILSNANFLVTLNTECNFTIDGQVVGNFYHLPNESTAALQYNALAFSASGLSNSQHDFAISINDLSYAVYINFDYAIYTFDDGATVLSSGIASTSGIAGTSTIAGASSTAGADSAAESTQASHSSSNSNLGIIIGCVLGGLVLILFAVVLWLRHRSQKEQKAPEPPISAFNREPPQRYRDDLVMSSGSHLPWQTSVFTESPSQGFMSLSAFSDQQSHLRSPSSDLGSEVATLVPVRREFQPLHIHSTKSQDDLRAVRQMEINQRLQNAQQEMYNLTSRQMIYGGLGSPTSEFGGPGAEQEMVTMREQIRELKTQIEQLQAERSSDWAQGLSDEPPPAYN